MCRVEIIVLLEKLDINISETALISSYSNIDKVSSRHMNDFMFIKTFDINVEKLSPFKVLTLRFVTLCRAHFKHLIN